LTSCSVGDKIALGASKRAQFYEFNHHLRLRSGEHKLVVLCHRLQRLHPRRARRWHVFVFYFRVAALERDLVCAAAKKSGLQTAMTFTDFMGMLFIFVALAFCTITIFGGFIGIFSKLR
jgi:hypothetical protein